MVCCTVLCSHVLGRRHASKLNKLAGSPNVWAGTGASGGSGRKEDEAQGQCHLGLKLCAIVINYIDLCGTQQCFTLLTIIPKYGVSHSWAC